MTTPGNLPPDAHPHRIGETAAQILMQEHRLILQALSALEARLDALEAGAPPDRGYFETAVEFLRTFADRCHHGKEEAILFETMVADLDYSRRSGPVAVLTAEHEQGRELIRRIAETSALLGQDPAAAGRLVQNGREYIRLLRVHIDREDNVVFPQAEQFLDEADQARLAAAFERFDRREGTADVEGPRVLLGL